VTSNINYNAINGNYPVPGVDNDTQTFRDNFTQIKTNFLAAYNEITDLQTNAARKDTANDYGLNVVSRAVFQNNREQTYNYGSISNSTTVFDYANGPYQYAVIAANTSISFLDLPGDPVYTAETTPIGMGSITMELYSDGSPRLVTFSTSGGTVLKKDPNFPNTIPLSNALTGAASGTYYFYSATPTATTTYASGGLNGSNTFVVSTNTNISNGQLVLGTGVPANTYVTNVAGTTITISNNLTAVASGTYTFYSPVVSATASGISGTSAITLSGSISGTIAAAQIVSGTNIPANTTVSGTYSAGNPTLLLTSATNPLFIRIWRRSQGVIFMRYDGIYS
jgi:hypothetical protein